MAKRPIRRARCLPLLLSLLYPPASHAQLSRVPVDEARSQAQFSVKALWLVEVRGGFSQLSGEMRVDAEQEQISVLARIETASLRMERTRYTAWAQSAELLDAARYPLIKFRSDPFPQARLRDGGALPGELDLHGTHLPVVFEILPASCRQIGWQCPLRVRGSVQRSDFGMHGRRGSISDRVQLEFDVFSTEPALSGHEH